MSVYCTVVRYCGFFGHAEAAQLGDDDRIEQDVDEDLFVAAVAGQDITGASADDQAAVAAAISRVQDALDSAQAEVDQQLVCQYADVMPLGDTVARDNGLPRHTANIARALLHRHDVPDAVKHAAGDTRAWLAKVARGHAKLLGIETGQGRTPAVGGMVSGQSASGFDWGSHGGHSRHHEPSALEPGY